MENSNDAVVSKCESGRIRKMHNNVKKIRSNKELEVKYMQAWEEKELERQEAYAEGREEGIQEGRQIGETRLTNLLIYLAEVGRQDDSIHALKDEEYRKKLYEELGI